jgi:hypothetical protein
VRHAASPFLRHNVPYPPDFGTRLFCSLRHGA